MPCMLFSQSERTHPPTVRSWWGNHRHMGWEWLDDGWTDINGILGHYSVLSYLRRGQCCLRVAAGPCLSNGQITQLSHYLTPNPSIRAQMCTSWDLTRLFVVKLYLMVIWRVCASSKFLIQEYSECRWYVNVWRVFCSRFGYCFMYVTFMIA